MDEVERSMLNADPVSDLRLTLAAFPLAALLRLERALEEGRLISGKYRDGEGRFGCPLYFLAGVCSKVELLARDFGTDEAWWAARRVVRYVDDGTLPPAAIAAVLAAVFAERRTARARRMKRVSPPTRTAA